MTTKWPNPFNLWANGVPEERGLADLRAGCSVGLVGRRMAPSGTLYIRKPRTLF